MRVGQNCVLQLFDIGNAKGNNKNWPDMSLRLDKLGALRVVKNRGDNSI